jgi:predicted CoA-binding protein
MVSPRRGYRPGAWRNCTIFAVLDHMTYAMTEVAGWERHLIEDGSGIRRVLSEAKRIAVLGMKPAETGQPAYYVPEYAQAAGFEVVPVPVYYPEAVEMLGEPVYRSLVAVPGEIDMVNVFRRARDIPAHLDDILAKRPKSVWFQLGIRNDAVAEELAREGIDVVQDRCLMVEMQRFGF